MNKIHLIHGIHTETGDSVVRGLIPFLEKIPGYTVVYPDYGFILGIESRRINRIVIGTLFPYIQPGDIVVGHSNGCCIGYELMVLGAPFVGGVFINAALDDDVTIPPQIKWVDVYSNEGDTITEVASAVEKFIGSPVDQYWGKMGHAGYTGKDGRVYNIYCDKNEWLPVVKGHSDLFSPTKLPWWGDYIVTRIVNYLKNG